MNKKLLYQGALASTNTTVIFTAAHPTTITGIKLVNTTGSDATIALYHNGTAAANAILPPTTILAGGHAEDDDPGIHMEPGDTLLIDQGTSGAITVSVYGEVTT
jgi:hypothetical protein